MTFITSSKVHSSKNKDDTLLALLMCCQVKRQLLLVQYFEVHIRTWTFSLNLIVTQIIITTTSTAIICDKTCYCSSTIVFYFDEIQCINQTKNKDICYNANPNTFVNTRNIDKLITLETRSLPTEKIVTIIIMMNK